MTYDGFLIGYVYLKNAIEHVFLMRKKVCSSTHRETYSRLSHPVAQLFSLTSSNFLKERPRRDALVFASWF